ncbi:MAG: hypothetical protein N2045_08760 [Fimbriimonadales bacterium]|jgi:tetratricopeptide (TPR) repeat protein|nr:hypothetical protein [Armatimonadota bacterium]MCX7688046.1 hypothetical protein [Fimbriimonadales bacterium]CUU11025.1 Tetratricopeptide repeat-containing protein [Armatimonadetes bacterium GBS]CUU35588.1 Tetratricopeptide repeat-containing protein [Armatimonadetes bacterium GXS]CUU38441.1 Tetratricopeptide repeat-containing protein [Armatimonadetes bacterium DC]GBC89553.1 hypothetical protein HRbin14_00279 [bacterium HR14]
MRSEITTSDRMASILKKHIDHEGVQTLLEAAATCDAANQYLIDGDPELALETALPLVLLETPVIAWRAREIAIAALDELIERASAEGDPARALKYVEQWLRLEPNAFYPLMRRAEIYQFELYDFHTAWATYLQILRHYPNSIEAMVGMAQLALMEGNPDRAYPYVLRAWQTLAKSEWAYTPSVRTLQSVFEDLYDITAGLLEWLGAHEDALQMLEQALSMLGESPLLKERLRLLIESEPSSD